MIRTKKFITIISLIGVILLSFVSCSFTKKDELAKNNIEIAALKGPTALGMTKLIEESENGFSSTANNISIYGDPSEIVAKFLNGEIDVAALPTNMAANLYQKMDGDIKVACLNTLGTIYILSRSDEIENVSDLKGKKLYASGQGATPEYALDYIIKANGLSENDIDIQYKSEHSELASLVLAGEVDLAMLPEPFVTQVLSKDPNVKIVLDLTKEWDKASDGKSLLTMGCLVARSDFINENKEDFDNLLDEYKESIDFTNNNVEQASILSEKYDIMDLDVARNAIPNCNIVFIEGNNMIEKTNEFLSVLFEANPKSIGGKLPDGMFYYTR